MRVLFCVWVLWLVLAGGASPAQAYEVRVAAWNVFDLPEFVFPVASAKRMRQVPEALRTLAARVGELDAIVFNELYVARDREDVLDALAAQGFAYHAQPLHDVPWLGMRYAGVVVVSRWPIVAESQHVFRGACDGVDCLTTKGSIYVRLAKPVGAKTQTIHLVGTHFYLGTAPAYQVSRMAQAQQLQGFLHTLDVLPGEPLIVAGDLNARREADGPAILQSLGADTVSYANAWPYTFVPGHHPLAGDPRQSPAQRCRALAEPTERLASRDGKWIDYVVTLHAGASLVSSSLVASAQIGEPYALSDDPDSCMLNVLSDHLPVVGSFAFAP